MKKPIINIILAFFLHQSAFNLCSEVIFDNTQTDYNGVFYPSALEFGDELIFSGSARTITEFQFQYYGNFVAIGKEQLRVRFYRTDGKWTNELGLVYNAPGTLIYTSDLLPLYPQYNTQTLVGLSINVKSNVFWSVQFIGLTGKFGNQAGLTFYDPPIVGFSYDDFWVNFPTNQTPSGWTPLNFQHNPVANFAAKVIAQPDPPLEISSLHVVKDGNYLAQINGPTYRGAVLETSRDLRQWIPFHSFFLTGQPTNILVQPAANDLMRYYRIKPLPEPTLLITTGEYSTTNNAQFDFHLMGTPGHNFTIEAGTDLAQWFPVYSDYLNGPTFTYTDIHAASFPSRRFYRASLQPETPVFFNSFTHLANGQMQLMLYGPRGRDCILQASPDLKQWQSLSTNTFSYIGDTISGPDTPSYIAGIINYTDTATVNANPRSYRAILPP